MINDLSISNFSRRLLLVFFSMVCLGLVAPHVEGAETKKIRMSFAALSGSVLPIWIAKDLGFFEKNGLDVDLVLTTGGPRTVATLLSGESPIVNTGANSAIAANLGGAKDAVILATFYNTLVFSVIGKPEIKNISALKGKSVGVTQIGSLSDFTARLVLSQAGLVAGRDVTILPTGDYVGMLVSLSKGIIDAGVMSAPHTLNGRKMGYHEILDVGATGIDYAGTSIATTRGFIRDIPETMRAAMKALFEATHRMKTDKEASIRVLARWTKSNDREVLEEVYNTYEKYLLKAPMPTVEGIKPVLESLAARVPKAMTANPRDFMEDRFVRELVDAGLLKKLY